MFIEAIGEKYRVDGWDPGTYGGARRTERFGWVIKEVEPCKS